jgi:hypothetical protein
MSTMQGIVVVALILVACVVMVIVSTENGRRRREKLRRRFGPEYDRAVQELGSEAKAQRELAARARRVDRIALHDINDDERARFGTAWSTIQTKFVDDPSGAVRDANDLIKTVMQSRGYPVADFEHRVADLSVDHAEVVQHYRAARALAEANREGRANTEELRQAFVHYRALFSELLAPPNVVPPSDQMHHARA